MRLLLITGAGASRRLGENGQPLPLIPDWATALCGALDQAEQQLAQACRLRPGMTGEEFEEALGLLLRWRQVRSLEERFAGLGGPQPNSVFNEVTVARNNASRRLEQIVAAINATLYEQFGQHRVDDASAADAYGRLLLELGVGDDLVVATTNYDRAAEAALAVLDRDPLTGFVSSPGRTPTLDVRGLMKRRREGTPVLHLHGSVGWYERDGIVYDHAADQPFNATLGTPVVLYPDPDKDPTNDALVSELWAEFRTALARSDHVLVLGHSLHDPALVQAIRDASPQNLAVTVFRDEERARVNRLLPEAIVIPADFGPALDVDRGAIAAFRG